MWKYEYIINLRRVTCSTTLLTKISHLWKHNVVFGHYWPVDLAHINIKGHFLYELLSESGFPNMPNINDLPLPRKFKMMDVLKHWCNSLLIVAVKVRFHRVPHIHWYHSPSIRNKGPLFTLSKKIQLKASFQPTLL